MFYLTYLANLLVMFWNRLFWNRLFKCFEIRSFHLKYETSLIHQKLFLSHYTFITNPITASTYKYDYHIIELIYHKMSSSDDSFTERCVYCVLNRIENEYSFYCSHRFVDGCFLISNSRKYHIGLKKDQAVSVSKLIDLLWHSKNSCHNYIKR